jgi:hypothetical protein
MANCGPCEGCRNQELRCSVSRALLVIGLGIVAFAVTLAIYVGTHLPSEVMTVLTGAACGVGAVLPGAIIGLLSLLRRREAERAVSPPPPAPYTAPQYPPVIVVASPNALPAGTGGWQGTYQPGYSAPVSARQFSVIGEEGVGR